jgi:hypothetical protein
MYVCERSAVRAAACTPRFGRRCLGRRWDRRGEALVLGQAFASLTLFARILSGPTNGRRRWAMRECSGERQVQGAAAAIGAGAAAATGHGAQAVAAAMGGIASVTGNGVSATTTGCRAKTNIQNLTHATGENLLISMPCKCFLQRTKLRLSCEEVDASAYRVLY